MNTKEALITLQDVSVTYPTGTHALQQINLQVGKGEFVFVVGSSGSGKSTFIKTLLGEVKATHGKIFVAKKQLDRIKRKELPYYRRILGVVFQEFRLLKDRNVYENVALAQRVVGVSKQKIEKNVMNILELVGLSGKEKMRPKELSGGEQQRVAIARAIVNEPAILLADEPTGNLDPTNSWEIMKLLEEANDRGTTVLVVTHNQEIVNEMKKRVVTMKKGVIVSDEKKGGYNNEN